MSMLQVGYSIDPPPSLMNYPPPLTISDVQNGQIVINLVEDEREANRLQNLTYSFIFCPLIFDALGNERTITLIDIPEELREEYTRIVNEIRGVFDHHNITMDSVRFLCDDPPFSYTYLRMSRLDY